MERVVVGRRICVFHKLMTGLKNAEVDYWCLIIGLWLVVPSECMNVPFFCRHEPFA